VAVTITVMVCDSQRVSCPLNIVSLANSYKAISVATHRYVPTSCLVEYTALNARD